jgi:hypothetical protein
VVPGVSGVFMLQADMALAFDMEGYLNPSNGDVNCTLVQRENQTMCPASPLLARAELYRDNNLLWVQSFEAAFVKMINTGCGNGVCKAVGSPVLYPNPTKAPARAPTKAPTKAPVRPATKAPVKAPVRAPAATIPVPGYCNWGPLGTGASSTCNGAVQGGWWCNGGSYNCQLCRGKWCTTKPVPEVGYCNWGPLGTGASSTCDGQRQGGDWCNGGSDNCNVCGGRWCA